MAFSPAPPRPPPKNRPGKQTSGASRCDVTVWSRPAVHGRPAGHGWLAVREGGSERERERGSEIGWKEERGSSFRSAEGRRGGKGERLEGEEGRESDRKEKRTGRAKGRRGGQGERKEGEEDRESDRHGLTVANGQI